MEDATDAELIQRSLERPAEFGVIFDRHASTMLRFLNRRAGPDLGSGLLGELFRVAFERRAAFDLSRSSARPWLYGIASNLLMHQGRSDARKARATNDFASQADLLTPAPLAEAAVVDLVDARLLLPNVAMALGQLPEVESEALLLFAWEDQSYEEIAEALDVPIGTIRSRIHRARGRLRELIGLRGKTLDESPDPPAAREHR